ncbi:uncharacterized protein GGS22DRAFT_27004 [Annulohypoxylon maeteangense]|uniref:uncharacterized protein n=1 Tax=Annulohypoxylon maeteangense TaxID=1927788 RepID=UPI002007AAE3|nr:uncharacterized protein GGS22DRAFT_27004 [Annulohypoxylon maeteangense]KAI0883880.1 hypothetical protein GGS22DRAFT_27004 [Annulohypoxylon maeteangense]
MTAVASPPNFTQHNRPTWSINGGHAGQINPMNPDELNRMFMPRKNLQRNNSSSSISSTSSVSSTSTIATTGSQTNGNSLPTSGDMGAWSNGAGNRKRPQPKAPWPSPKPDSQSDFVRMSAGRPQLVAGINGSAPMHSPSPVLPSQGLIGAQQAMPRPITDSLPAGNQPVLYLLSLNGTFERKTISVPFSPETLRIGRQTNAKTVPTPMNGFFDSKVLSRQHAEIWADRNGKIWIRDVKSSNGTFVNGTRLSQENRESEPHELQTADHLELGIDIVSEDQKTVVHHKVAAKVEHAGFLNPSSSLLDMNFGDLDPANGSMMMMGQQGGVPIRPRNGSQASMASNGRIVQNGGMMGSQTNVMSHQRGLFFSPISTEQIVKRLQHEMRTQRLQSQDLGRTNQFLQGLLTKDDIKDSEKPDSFEQPKSQIINGNGVNGNGLSFRSDNKTRFSDPPAPPPQQPLPEKPDVPSLKRGITERPKQSNNQNISPVRQDSNTSQILQLTEALNSAKREIESQSTRMRDLEETLLKERQARELAEELARRLEESATAKTNGVPVKSDTQETALEAAFEPPVEEASTPVTNGVTDEIKKAVPQAEAIEASATHLHAQIESMVLEMKDLRQQLETFKQRAETAEAERDADRKSLAEMALQIRRDVEAREAAAKEKALVDSRAIENTNNPIVKSKNSPNLVRKSSTGSTSTPSSPGELADQPTLSRANTITPQSAAPGLLSHNQALTDSIPYASMMGVVIIGMGLMAYINGWQPQPRLER